MKAGRKQASKLDPYKPVIDSWLLQDRKRRAKQRHTAKRVYDRLVAECEFDGGYTIVQQYVKARRSELKRAKDEFLHLEWAPAEAQVDFGVCDFRILGIVREVRYLVVTFPFSNVSLAQCFRGENPECVCEGLKAVFEFCGGVPTRLVFDNATGVGRRVGEAISTADTFERFAAHYGFSFTFCNPRSGNEKGAVENAVGAVRRNVFVPMPRVDNLRAHNKRLLDACMGRADKDHYLKGEPERQLFEEDCASMLELPARPFRAAKVGSAKTDKYGDVCLEGRHRYPLGPEHARERVGVELGRSPSRSARPRASRSPSSIGLTAMRPPGRAIRSPSSPSFVASRAPGATARCAPRRRRASRRRSTRWASPTGGRRSGCCGT